MRVIITFMKIILKYFTFKLKFILPFNIKNIQRLIDLNFQTGINILYFI